MAKWASMVKPTFNEFAMSRESCDLLVFAGSNPAFAANKQFKQAKQ